MRDTMITLQEIINIEQPSAKPEVQYLISVKTKQNFDVSGSIEMSGYGYESQIQTQLTAYFEGQENMDNFVLFKNGDSIKISEIVHLKVEKGSTILPF